MVLDELERVLLHDTTLSTGCIDYLMFRLRKELDNYYQDGYDDALSEVSRHVVILGLND